MVQCGRAGQGRELKQGLRLGVADDAQLGETRGGRSDGPLIRQVEQQTQPRLFNWGRADWCGAGDVVEVAPPTRHPCAPPA